MMRSSGSGRQRQALYGCLEELDRELVQSKRETSHRLMVVHICAVQGSGKPEEEAGLCDHQEAEDTQVANPQLLHLFSQSLNIPCSCSSVPSPCSFVNCTMFSCKTRIFPCRTECLLKKTSGVRNRLDHQSIYVPFC